MPSLAEPHHLPHHVNFQDYDSLVIAGFFMFFAPILVIVGVLLPGYLWYMSSLQSQRPKQEENLETYAFFHPYCSGGGGGERVLWKMIQHLQQQNKHVMIYTIDPPNTDEARMRKDASQRFDVEISQPVQLISLYEYRHYLQPAPFLSLVMESWGTMKLAHQALQLTGSKPPDVFCDTTGCAFTFLVVWLMLPATTWIMAYVHYPTISTDMMAWEWQHQQSTSMKTRLKKNIKLVYYWIFAIMYGLVGSLADLVMVNSTWTRDHIQFLWRFGKKRRKIHIVYPPCRVPEKMVSSSPQQREKTIVSIGQFRPEKDHALQIKALQRLLELYPSEHAKIKLILIGSCRNESDQQRVTELQQLVKDCLLEEKVEFHINPPYEELEQSMQQAWIGIHTMRQEHFGIGIVEMMAAGLITIAHKSGGPLTDIVEPGVNGFLAISATEYAECIHQALTMDSVELEQMRTKAQASATRFSDPVFEQNLTRVLPLLTQ